MKHILVMLFLCAQTILGIEAIQFEFDDYKTLIYFTHFPQDAFRGTIENETELFGRCEGTFFYDLEHRRLKLSFSEEKCAQQNMEIEINIHSFNTLKNGWPTRVFYEQEIPPFNPQQVIMRIRPKITTN